MTWTRFSAPTAVADLDREWIHRKPVLSGLINEYTRAALHPEDSQVTQADPIFERDRLTVRIARSFKAVFGPRLTGQPDASPYREHEKTLNVLPLRPELGKNRRRSRSRNL